MASFLTLPNEVIELILNEVPSRSHVLATLCSVSHSYQTAFEVFLYENVKIRSASQSNQLLEAFKRTPRNALLVRTLSFERNPPVIGSKSPVDDGELVARLTNLVTLRVNGWRSRQGIWRSIQNSIFRAGRGTHLQRLEELVVTGLGRREPIWPQAIMSLPNLKSISFHMCRLASEPAPTTFSTSTLPALQLLSLSSFDADPKTLEELLNARSFTTLRLEEALRVKYTEPGEFVGSPDGMLKLVERLPVGNSTHLKHLVHSDPKDWGCRKLCLDAFGSLVYLEVNGRDLYGTLGRLGPERSTDKDKFLQGLVPPSLEILSLDVPASEEQWALFEEFVRAVALDKEMVAPRLRTIIWHRKDTAHILDGVSKDVEKACKTALIDIMAAPFSRIYLDGGGKLAGVADRMCARHDE